MARLNSADNKQHDSEILARRAAQVQGGAARAAVLGINDGLVSTVCLILGVAAASEGAQHPVLIAGFAGLIAGAFSMAAGEWISVKSQVELFEGILGDLKKLVKNDIALLRETLESKLVASGMSPKAAQTAAHDMAKKDTHFSEIYAVQVLGVNPDELGSPWTAAVSSLALFTLGSLVALAPWFFIGGSTAALLSIIFTSVVSLGVGAYIARSSGKSLWYGAIRQFLIVLLASAVTYGVGLLFGVALN
ncbi:MAG: VIT1/CCC1 transporter family protein [Candidatus Saccharimonadales bacterium]|jgi:VIT1/CCC1 family predicted Fe2+/Mn2+ transporter